MTTVEGYPKGHVVGVFKPFMHHLSSQFLVFRCNNCFLKKESLNKCSGCSWVAYCDSACQKRNWKAHRFVCALVQRAFHLNPACPTIPTDSVLFLYKLYCYAKTDKAQAIKDEIVGVQRSYSHLMTHVEEIKLDGSRMSKFYDAYVQLKIFIGNRNTNDSNDSHYNGTIDEPLLFETFGKMVINSYSILDEDLNDIGTGIYLGPSLLDHSCQGNSVCVFNGSTLTLRTITAVKPNEQLSISYIDVMSSTAERSMELMQSYYFVCKCHYCTDHLRDKEMNGVVVENSNKLKCKENEDGEDDEQRLMLQVQDDFKEFSLKAKDKDDEELYDLTVELEKKWRGCVTERNISLFHVLQHRYECCVVMQKWGEALLVGARISSIYEYYLQNPLPNYVFHLVKLAKIHLFLHENLEALQILEKVAPMMPLLFDKRHLISLRFQQLLHQCSSELALQ